MCAGLSYYTPFMDSNFKECTDDRGRIFVNEHFQVTSQDPNKSPDLNSVVHENIFWYGDAASTPMQEAKNIPAIRQTCSIVSYNLKAVNSGTKLKSMPVVLNMLAGVYFSKWKGVSIFNDFALPSCLTLKVKESIESKYMAKYKNKCCGKCKYGMYSCQFSSVMCCLSKCWCCCKWSKRNAYKRRRKAVRAIIEEHKASQSKK